MMIGQIEFKKPVEKHMRNQLTRFGRRSVIVTRARSGGLAIVYRARGSGHANVSTAIAAISRSIAIYITSNVDRKYFLNSWTVRERPFGFIVRRPIVLDV